MNYSSVIKVPDEKTLDALCAKTFNQLLIHPYVILRIRDIDYKLPTAIQAGALPLALSGKDLIVQSPPESGKTLVFAALAAHIVNDNHQSKQREPFVTILAASSEHVTKIKNLIVKLVPDGNYVCAFYGDGDDFTNEKIANGCSVVIGTPDRMAKLCADGGITIKRSQLLIIDDADKLMAPTFVEDIQSVFENRGSVVQVAAFCSSYPDGIERFLRQFMDSPSIFRIDRQDVQLSAANRDDKVAVEDNTPEIDDGIATSQSEQLSKNVSNESSASPAKTLPGSSRNANVDKPSMASQSTNTNVDEPLMASQSAAVQLSTTNRDDKVAVKDNIPETDDGIAASQSEQLSKNVSSDESSTKTLSGDRQDVQLNAANRDDEVAIEDKTPEIERDVKDNTPEKATSQSDQLSKNVSSNEPSASPSKTSPESSTNANVDEPSVAYQSAAVQLSTANRDDKVAVKDNTPETDDGITALQSEQLSKNVSSDGFSASSTKTSSGDRQDVELNAANRDDKVATDDKTHEIDRDVKDNTPEKATSQSDQLSKNEPSASPSKISPGGSFEQPNGFGAQNNGGSHGFGSASGGSRGGFGQSNGFGLQNNDSGFGSTRGGSRGGFGQSNGFGSQNNDSGFGSTRSGSRGGFGAQNNHDGQSFGNTRGGSKGGFGGGGNKGLYNRSTEFGGDNQMSSSRGSFGRDGGGFGQINNSDDQMNSSRAGFGRASRGSYGRGGFGQSNDNQQYSNGFGENQMDSSGSNRGFPSRGGSFGGRGGFGTSDSAENQMSLSGATRGGSFGGGRGGFGTSNSAQDQMNSSGSIRGFPSRGGSFGGRGGFGTSDSAENQINSPILNRRGHFHSNSDYGQSSHGGSGFGHPAADNSQDAPAPVDKPQPLVLGHRFVR
jgi:hypothetical protein